MALCTAFAGCSAASAPEIALDFADSKAPAIVVHGLSRGDLRALEGAELSRDAWTALLRVAVAADGRPAAVPVSGTYAVAAGTIRFTPILPFEGGRQYVVVFDPAAAAGGTLAHRSKITRVLATPPPPRAPPVHVAAVYPTGPEVPANLLRMYVEFSGPMGSLAGQDYIRLVDASGNDLEGALLPLNTDLWNGDRTRFTILFDPGRVKRGILPNRAMGRPLAPGGSFSIVIKREWPDASGQPLAGEFRKEYRVGQPIERTLGSRPWRIAAPAAGSRDPLVVTFGWALDHALLLRAVRVSRELGSEAEAVPGEVRAGAAETQWTFVPSAPWHAGGHLLIADAYLEDPAGNRYYRAFEEETGEGPRYGPASLPFTIR